VNGGTKLQKLPEIKNYTLEYAPNGQKGKGRNFIVQMLWSKSTKKSRKGAKQWLSLRLGPLREQ